jgi:hypothetical protein
LGVVVGDRSRRKRNNFWFVLLFCDEGGSSRGMGIEGRALDSGRRVGRNSCYRTMEAVYPWRPV